LDLPGIDEGRASSPLSTRDPDPATARIYETLYQEYVVRAAQSIAT
jgi:hypothetical protein